MPEPNREILSLGEYLRRLQHHYDTTGTPEPMNLDQYMQLLQQRAAEFMAPRIAHARGKKLQPLPPLLEWFILPTDEQFVELPTPAPKRKPTPRRYRSSHELRALRDQLDARRTAIMFGGHPDPAACNIGSSSRWKKLDRDIAAVVKLTKRIERLDGRIASAEARERRQR
ncbi:hypothetical protein [Mycolicibacterium mageritense]|uniref:hypothetical protein n=1 Tax=Mycolicibacterium mageritense TaxID=53462 RepID=UPI001E330B5F|nr:hypothetical protein [Mycolicibacterium mageritense]MCC9186692.1 hypothetical protein [Mycolicibacterium mageritense]